MSKRQQEAQAANSSRRAQVAEEMQKREAREKRNSKIFKGLAVGLPLLVVAGVTTGIVMNNKSQELPTQLVQPANTTEHGVMTTVGGKVITEIKENDKGEKPVLVTIYQDYLCPACKAFEEGETGQAIEYLRDTGEIVVEHRPTTYLDRASSGTSYSSRSAAAMACVVNSSPDAYSNFFDTLYTNQPEEFGTMPKNSQLIEWATEAGASDITECVESNIYRPWVASNTEAATEVGIQGTPEVWIGGERWESGTNLQEAIDAAKKRQDEPVAS